MGLLSKNQYILQLLVTLNFDVKQLTHVFPVDFLVCFSTWDVFKSFHSPCNATDIKLSRNTECTHSII